MSVAQEFRPTLREELGGWRPATRRAVFVLLALGILAVAVWLVVPRHNGVHYVHRSDPVFNLRYAAAFKKLEPRRGELLQIRRKGPRGRVLDTFSVRRLRLPPYRGDVNGLLPVYAESVLAQLRNAYPGLKLLEEGKARVNLVAGYYLLFRVGKGRKRMFGREVLLPQPKPGARDGVRMALRTFKGSGVATARDLGAHGALKTPYRSFRYGTEAP